VSYYDPVNRGGRPVGSLKHGRINRTETQAQAARAKGISRGSQRKIDKLHSLRPDLLAQVEAGEISLAKAVYTGGLGEERFTLTRDTRKAVGTLNRRLTVEEIDDLVLALTIQQAANYRLTPKAYTDALSAAVLEAVSTPKPAPANPSAATGRRVDS
jgi:hypothetical protein